MCMHANSGSRTISGQTLGEMLLPAPFRAHALPPVLDIRLYQEELPAF